jgi:hypothetical protein
MVKLKLLALTAALAGCSSVPIDLGGKDEIQYAGAETIRMRWDPQRTTERNVRAKAVAYCSGRQVDEVAASHETGASGPLEVKTWQCRSASGAGM